MSLRELDPAGCQEYVSDRDIWHSYQCQKKPKVERDGKKYCTVHDPEYIKEKERKQQEKYESQRCKGSGCHFNFGSTTITRMYRYCPWCGTKRTSK